MRWSAYIGLARDKYKVLGLTLAAHRDGVGYADSIELPSQHAFSLNSPFDDFTKFKHYSMS